MPLWCLGRAQKRVQPDSKTANGNSCVVIQTAVLCGWGNDLGQRRALRSDSLRPGCRRACGSWFQVALLPGLIKQRRYHVTERISASLCPNSPNTVSLWSYGLANWKVGPARRVPPPIDVAWIYPGKESVCLSLHGCLYLQASRNSHRGENTIFQGTNSLWFNRARGFRGGTR